MFTVFKNGRGRPKHSDILTPAEWRIVNAVRHGLSNRNIAQLLGISLDGVKFHLKAIKEKIGLKTKFEIRHWHGISKQSALFNREYEMETSFTGKIYQISRIVRDLSSAIDFYGNTLGLKLIFQFPKLAFFECGEVRLMLSENENIGAQSIIYFEVRDIHKAKDELEAKGVIFIGAPHMIYKHEDGTEEYLAAFNDNENNPVGIMSKVKPT